MYGYTACIPRRHTGRPTPHANCITYLKSLVYVYKKILYTCLDITSICTVYNTEHSSNVRRDSLYNLSQVSVSLSLCRGSLSISRSLCLSDTISLSLCLSVSLSLCLSVSLSLCLSELVSRLSGLISLSTLYRYISILKFKLNGT